MLASICRALVLYVFYLCLNSFGMDWIIGDLIGIFITTSLFKNFYKMEGRVPESACEDGELVGNVPA